MDNLFNTLHPLHAHHFLKHTSAPDSHRAKNSTCRGQRGAVMWATTSAAWQNFASGFTIR